MLIEPAGATNTVLQILMMRVILVVVIKGMRRSEHSFNAWSRSISAEASSRFRPSTSSRKLLFSSSSVSPRREIAARSSFSRSISLCTESRSDMISVYSRRAKGVLVLLIRLIPLLLHRLQVHFQLVNLPGVTCPLLLQAGVALQQLLNSLAECLILRHLHRQLAHHLRVEVVQVGVSVGNGGGRSGGQVDRVSGDVGSEKAARRSDDRQRGVLETETA
ncbi:hypothetical protein TYRP_015764 [Tyrophagus putrescentiae]|nr:hypothetical protein TYRP_015764 [Tyrophagus putrescentiae]